MGYIVKCPNCDALNDVGVEECVGCHKPLRGVESVPFLLEECDGVRTRTIIYAGDLGEILGELIERLHGASAVLRGVDEARLARVLDRMRADLGPEQFALLRRYAEGVLEDRIDERQEGLRIAVTDMLHWVDGGGPGGRCVEPVKVSVEMEHDTPDNLTDLQVTVTRQRSSVRKARISIECDPLFRRVIQIGSPEKEEQALVAVRSRSFVFPVELHGRGRPRLPVKVHLSCERGRGRTPCSCCYKALIRWRIGADQRQEVTINKVEVLRPDSSLIRVDFDRDAFQAERDTLDGETPRKKTPERIRFDLPLYLDCPAVQERVGGGFGTEPDCRDGGAMVRGGHFLVQRTNRGEDGDGEPAGGDAASRADRRVFFVLLDEKLRLGRSHQNHIVTRYGRLNADESHWGFVSKKHAQLEWDRKEDAVRLKDGREGRSETGEPVWKYSVNGTRPRREGVHLHKLGGSQDNVDLGEEDAILLDDEDQIRIPPRGGSVESPYELDFREFRSGRSGSGGRQHALAYVLAPSPYVHEALQPAPPYLYAWLPDERHEILVGSGPGVSVQIPSLDAVHAFRIHRDAAGYLYVSPCTGVEVKLRGRSRQRKHIRSRTLAPHVWACLGDYDELTCGTTKLTFRRHSATERTLVPDLGACYRSRRGPGPFQPPEDFRDLLLPLMVPAE